MNGNGKKKEDGEFTFEETELILQAAGYFINEFGVYHSDWTLYKMQP